MRVVAGPGRGVPGEPPRSTAYYYADLERLKRPAADELGEYVAPAELLAEPLAEPPAEPAAGEARGETYSTAGTFPMPEPREKEPLLAELEAVGRLPLTQLGAGGAGGVRRSRSWYLCCPTAPDEDASRESSWRYSSLRPVTAPPLPAQNGIPPMAGAGGAGGAADAAALRAERDALARALAAERARAAAAARAHDARLAELHGVIAELVRRRAADKRAAAILEEEVSDECESTTQPAGELEHSDQRSDSLSAERSAQPPDETSEPSAPAPPSLSCRAAGDTSPELSERDSEICVSTARCCQHARAHAAGAPGRGSGMLPASLASPGRCAARQARLAARVRLRRADHSAADHLIDDEAAERLALDVCAQADLREALAAAGNDESAGGGGGGAAALWRARCVRLAADCRVLDCALARAVDTAHRLSCACALHESSSVALCSALRAADRALETYDVLLALAETAAHAPRAPERLAAEGVALRLARRLARAPAWGEPLLSAGPWHDHHVSPPGEEEHEVEVWSPALEARLRRVAARLKRDTVELRHARPAPRLYSPHDTEEGADESCGADSQAADMEAAVVMQEVLAAREARLAERLAAAGHESEDEDEGEGGGGSGAGRHWLRAQPETEL